MIAKVKIAPLERWCPGVLSRDTGKFNRLPGIEIEILSESMRSTLDLPLHEHPCGGRMWEVTSGSREKVAAILDRALVAMFVCEHLLEMD